MSQSHTPPKPRISGQVSSTASGTIPSQSWLFEDELMGRLHQIRFPDFRSAFLAHQDDKPGDADVLLSAAKECHSSTDLRAHFDDFSRVVATGKEPPNIYGPLVNIMNFVVEFTREKHAASDALPLKFTDESSTLPIRGTDQDRKPDIVGVRSPEIHWSAVSIVCEYKSKSPASRRTLPKSTASRPSNTFHSSYSQSQSQHDSSLHVPPSSGVSRRKARKSDLQLARYMLEMRAAQHTRAAGYGILFEKDQASFWYSDADSTIISEPVSIDSFDFVYAIMNLARANASGLGYLSEFVDKSNVVHTEAVGSHLVLDKTYKIIRVISHVRAIHGRCTSVYLGEDETNKCYVIKLSWQVTTRANEATMIKLAHDRDVKGIVEVLHTKDLRVLSSGRRCHLPPDVQSAVQREDRCLRALVLPQYMPLYEVQDPVHFLKACISLLNTIHELHEKANILHRDVSVNNLMVRMEAQWEGVLIDFDLALDQTPVGSNNQGPTSLHRTGTLPFMALDLLNDKDDYPHHHRHDLESFVYVLAWIAGRYENGHEVYTNRFNDWCEGSWTNMSGSKILFLTFGNYPIFPFTSSFEFLEPFIVNTRRRLDTAYSNVRFELVRRASKRPRTSVDRSTKRTEPPERSYSNSSHDGKRKPDTGKSRAVSKDDSTSTEVLVYPPELPGFNYTVLHSELQGVLGETEEASTT